MKREKEMLRKGNAQQDKPLPVWEDPQKQKKIKIQRKKGKQKKR
jgi:hypothetical protein